ncbi:hypothetical protein [Paractinoplanes durhamensis]|uniref:Uncharacterized protein n=1 Tax=Paractinoplanes durhamensis TaxID=113563 RepID=A0ABQ3YWZ1_9ACTN|nr:hypothetical protein [Actinoplanes durhamensis]GIE02105.1 hypothetical protein Adu01nite_34550 [Actinoplanes durhamensis]
MTTTAATVPRPHRPLLILTAAMGALAVVTALGILLDPRVLTGMPIWAKPFKFAVSFTVYGFTLAWMLSVLPRRSRVAEWAATVIVGVAVIEQGIIVLQAARGTTSHYNQSTAFDAALWSAMGTSIMVLFLAHLVISIGALRQRLPDRVVATGIRLGLGLSLLGMLAAGPMVYGPHYGAHSVGVPDGGPGLPLTGWSTTGGDLRIGHFVGLHALQALPLLALLLNRFPASLDVRTRVRLLRIAGTAYGVLVTLLTWQALRAEPLLKPGGLTLTAVAALFAAAAGATWLALARRANA